MAGYGFKPDNACPKWFFKTEFIIPDLIRILIKLDRSDPDLCLFKKLEFQWSLPSNPCCDIQSHVQERGVDNGLADVNDLYRHLLQFLQILDPDISSEGDLDAIPSDPFPSALNPPVRYLPSSLYRS